MMNAGKLRAAWNIGDHVSILIDEQSVLCVFWNFFVVQNDTNFSTLYALWISCHGLSQYVVSITLLTAYVTLRLYTLNPTIIEYM